jgi:hypothetical protein
MGREVSTTVGGSRFVVRRLVRGALDVRWHIFASLPNISAGGIKYVGRIANDILVSTILSASDDDEVRIVASY